MKVYKIVLGNGATIEFPAKSEKDAKLQVQKLFGYFIVNIKQVR